MKNFFGIERLKFVPELESQFKQYISLQDKRYIRVALSLFMFLFAAFSISDFLLVPESFKFFFAIRFYIVIPALLMVLATTFSPIYVNFKQLILLGAFLTGGFGIAVMLVVHPLNIVYYGGLFLVFTSGYFLLNLNYQYAIFGGFTILSTFLMGAIIYGVMSLQVFIAFIFLLSENILGSFGAYQLEALRRKEFLSLDNLNKEHLQLSYVVDDKIKELSTAQISTITALANLAESRDQETGEHIERVSILCHEMAMAMPLNYFINAKEKEDFVDTIRHASVLHDIGKVAISDVILNKPGPLTPEEIYEMRKHAKIGSKTLVKLHEEYPNNLFVKLGIEITQYHHEYWDGNGYPEGLRGNNIPLSARIMAIADVYDALVSKRPYKPAFSHEKALQIITDESGTHFDPDLVKIFLEIMKRVS